MSNIPQEITEKQTSPSSICQQTRLSSSFISNRMLTNTIYVLQNFQQAKSRGDAVTQGAHLRVIKAGGARLPWRTVFVSVFNRGRLLWGYLIYWSYRYKTLIWGLGACPQENFVKPKCLQCLKMPLQRIGELNRVQ